MEEGRSIADSNRSSQLADQKGGTEMREERRLSRREFLRFAALAGTGTLVAACVPPTPEVVEKTKIVKETKKVTKEVEKVVTATPAPEVPGVEEIPRNRTLIMAGLGGEMVGGFTDVEMFNPHVHGGSRSGLYQAGTEGLFYYNMIGDEFKPWLAKDYEYNDDYTEVTIHLRKGVEWSDGHPFDSKDVCHTLMEVLKPNPSLNRAGVGRYLKDCQAVDDLTVKIVFEFPSPRFVWDWLTFRADLGIPITPEHVWKGKDPTKFNNYDPDKGWPLVTGPYKLVASTVEQKIWDLRPDWWATKTGFQKLPEVERLVFLPGMNEITMAQMMIANEIDMAFSMTPKNMQLIQNQNQKVITHCDRPPYGFVDWWPIGLAVNTKVEPFDDPEIRWAMSYAINRDEIVRIAFSGYSSPAKLPYPDYPGLQEYMDGVKDLLEEYNPNEHDPSKTKEIMTKKGYKKDDEGFWVDAEGERITFEIVTFPQHPSCTPSVPIVAEQLRRSGFDASFLLPADFASRISNGEAKAFIWGHGGSMKDPYKTLDLYHCRGVKPIGEASWGNLYRWCNQEFSSIVDEMAKTELDAPEMMDLFHEAMEIWLQELPDIPLVQTVIQLPMNTTYWKGWPSCDDPYVHEGFWHRTTMLMWNRLEPQA